MVAPPYTANTRTPFPKREPIPAVQKRASIARRRKRRPMWFLQQSPTPIHTLDQSYRPITSMLQEPYREYYGRELHREE
jgi:hypothetical protein